MTDDATKRAHEAVETPLDWSHVRCCDCFALPEDPPYEIDARCRKLTDSIHTAIDAAVKAAEERGGFPSHDARCKAEAEQWQESFDAAAADMRERAAKLCEIDSCSLDEDCHGRDATAIRALPLHKESDDGV